MRIPSVLLVLALALAGCSGGGDDGGSPPASSLASSTSTAPPPPPVPRTDTLHFLEAPKMTAIAPTGGDVRSPVATANFGGGPGGPEQELGATWMHQVTTPTNITNAEIHVWVDIKEQMFDTRTEPLQPRCTWALQLSLGSDTETIVSCINEPPGPINPGVKELVFTAVLDGAIELEANETVTVLLSRTAFSLSPNNAVDALSGSAEHDSRIVLKGLKEPLVA